MNKKMADVDIDSFGEHESRPEEPTDECIPLDLVTPGGGGSTWEPTHSRKNDLILIMTPEKQDKTLELSKHWSVDSTPARNEMIMKRTYPVKLVKCNKICSNY